MLFTFRKVFKENLPLMMKINRENTAVNKRKMNEVVKNSKKDVCPSCRLKQGQRKLLSEIEYNYLIRSFYLCLSYQCWTLVGLSLDNNTKNMESFFDLLCKKAIEMCNLIFKNDIDRDTGVKFFLFFKKKKEHQIYIVLMTLKSN